MVQSRFELFGRFLGAFLAGGPLCLAYGFGASSALYLTGGWCGGNTLCRAGGFSASSTRCFTCHRRATGHLGSTTYVTAGDVLRSTSSWCSGRDSHTTTAQPSAAQTAQRGTMLFGGFTLRMIRAAGTDRIAKT